MKKFDYEKMKELGWHSCKEEKPPVAFKTARQMLSAMYWVCDAWGRTGFGIWHGGKDLCAFEGYSDAYDTQEEADYNHGSWFCGGGTDSVRIDWWKELPEVAVIEE